MANEILSSLLREYDQKRLMAESDALIIPSFCYEGFPMTIVEAYSVGTPIIGSYFGNVGCLIQDGITGEKINPYDCVSIIGALEKDYDNLRQTTFDLYNRKYTKDVNYDILSRIYSIVC